MDKTVLIFLAIAVMIIAMAVFLPRAFKKSIEADKRHEDPNGDPRDGAGTATWAGINHAND